MIPITATKEGAGRHQTLPGLWGGMWGRKQKRPERGVFTDALAEREGFEPSIRLNRIPDFESGAFDHSATFPLEAPDYRHSVGKSQNFMQILRCER